jgi:hypothetical protein
MSVISTEHEGPADAALNWRNQALALKIRSLSIRFKFEAFDRNRNLSVKEMFRQRSFV